MSKILVTGGAGFIGSNLVRFLLDHTDHEVICVDNFNDYYSPETKEANVRPFLGNGRFRLHRADITDQAAMSEIFETERPDKVCHLAGRAGVRDSFAYPDLYQKVNVDATRDLLDLSVKHGVGNFVFASSSSVYGDQRKVPFSETDPVDNPISVYASTKKDCENICREVHENSGLPITALRFFTVYGPSGRPDMAPWKFVESVHKEKPLTRFGDGSTQRDYTYIDDIVDGIVASLDKNLPFEIINLGDSAPVTLNEFIATVERVVGKKAIIEQHPMQRGDVTVTYADIERAKRLLGYQPKVGLEEGLKRFFDWYLESAI